MVGALYLDADVHPGADHDRVTGIVIGGIVVAMYLPMFDMINAVQ